MRTHSRTHTHVVESLFEKRHTLRALLQTRLSYTRTHTHLHLNVHCREPTPKKKHPIFRVLVQIRVWERFVSLPLTPKRAL